MINANANVPDTKLINLNTMSSMPIEKVIDLYRQGYRLDMNNTGIGINSTATISSLSTCPSQIQKGTSKTITITPSSGSPPYDLEFSVDGVSHKIFSKVTTAQTLDYTFNETLGNHNYQAKITDSCTTPGPQTSTDTCTIELVSTPVVTGPCKPGFIPVAQQCYDIKYVAAAGIGLILLLAVLK